MRFRTDFETITPSESITYANELHSNEIADRVSVSISMRRLLLPLSICSYCLQLMFACTGKFTDGAHNDVYCAIELSLN